MRHMRVAFGLLLARADGSRQRTIPSAAHGISGSCGDIVDPSKMTLAV